MCIGDRVEAGAALDQASKGDSTALISAAAGGHEAAVRALVEAGAAVELADKGGGTALIGAARGGHEAAGLSLIHL